MKMTKARSLKRGFTLIEILVAIVLMASVGFAALQTVINGQQRILSTNQSSFIRQWHYQQINVLAEGGMESQTLSGFTRNFVIADTTVTWVVTFGSPLDPKLRPFQSVIQWTSPEGVEVTHALSGVQRYR